MLAVIMFLNGLAIMVLEMVGARLLAPWLGTSITVWTSLIGIILAFMSVGYFLGGKLADKLLHPSQKEVNTATLYARAISVLSRLLLTAACSVLITALLQSFILSALTQAIKSLHLAAICAAIVLFALPSLLCGMVSPFTMRLAITHSEKAGSVIGKLNAIATIGSILGTFLGGFILISWFGSKEIILGVAFCFIVMAALVKTRPYLPYTSILLLLGIVSGYQWYFDKQFTPYKRVTVQSAYNTMIISEGTYATKPARFLQTDPGSAQSAMYVNAPKELLFAYSQRYRLGPALIPNASNILMLGGGGYSIPKWLLQDDANITLDVVELDAGMTKVAQDYFAAPTSADPRLHIFHEDARTFINRASADSANTNKYQLIFTDVFNSYYSVPFHLGTKESAEKIRTLLDDEGMVLMNIITAIEGDNGKLLRSIYHAFAQVFPEIILLPVQNQYNGELLQNVMLLAFATPKNISKETMEQLPPDLRTMLEMQWIKNIPTDVPPLTDNFSPVERYTIHFHKS